MPVRLSTHVRREATLVHFALAAGLLAIAGAASPTRADITFDEIPAGLTSVFYGSVAWGDYDSDGDLDLVLTGWDGSQRIAKVYRNSGSANPTFTDIGAGLPGVWHGAVAWGDYDNDGDLDLLLTGEGSSSQRIAKVYRNSGGANPTFEDINAGMTGVRDGSVAWGDYDNDGDLDLLLTGEGSSLQFIAKVYRNSGGANPTFTDIGAGLTGVASGSVAWGDYDNDGDLDLLLTGQGSQRIAKVYRNSGGGTPSFTDIGAGLTGVFLSSATWGDYDNDGDLDLLLTGRDAANQPIAKVYRNSGGATPSFTDIGAGLTGVNGSSVAWGDYDNDGDLDLLLAGADASDQAIAQVYRNSGGATPSFTDIGTGLTGVFYSAVAWGDYDNDGDVDLLLTGDDGSNQGIATVYRNSGAPPNTPPGAPSALSTSVAGNQVTFSWTAANDAQTPAAGLSYNLRVGTTPGGDEISAAMADDVSGYRHIPALGNAQERTSWTLTLPSGGPYFWSVQAIDGAWAGGPFATERSFRLITFDDIGAGLPGVSGSSAAWGDYDNDGDLDLLLTGLDAGNQSIAKVYRNSGGPTPSFTDIGAGLTGVSLGSVAWGDYDNDGDLDLLLTGYDGSQGIAQVYRNSGGATPSFTDIGAGLSGVYVSSVAWGDYDNDGDLDLLLTGRDNQPQPMAKVYRNSGGATPSFTDIGPGLTGVFVGSVAWGDYDNDGDLDLLLTGRDSGNQSIAKVYRNSGSANPTFTDIGAGLPGVINSSLAWGDYDNDGDLDLLLTGDDGSQRIAKVYRNSGGATPSFTDIGAGLTGTHYSSVAWGDYDNDGDLDLLLTGLPAGNQRIAQVYRNSGGAMPSFTDIGAGLPGVSQSSVAWGDYDNDGDLDILLTGLGTIARVYRNEGAPANTAPGAPSNLSEVVAGNQATLSWTAASDNETPAAGLSYNLRIGTTPGGDEITAAMADGASGYRRIPALGNTQERTSWTLTLPPGGPYYWSVQAIDGAWAGGPFAAERSFRLITFDDIGAGLPALVDGAVAWGDYDNDGDLDLLLAGIDASSFRIAQVFRNEGGATPSFTDVGASLAGVSQSAVAWGDYDQDGDLDILLMGADESGVRITRLYRNEGGPTPTFSDIGAALTGVNNGAVAWGDYDNDGDLDILLTGNSSSGRIAKVYRNEGGATPSFTDVGAALTSVSLSAVAWGDYDQDGDLDILLTGISASARIAQVYRNEGSATPSFSDIGASLAGVRDGSVAWGDYDNDGDLDILLTGHDAGSFTIAQVYRNEGGATPSFSDIGAGLTGVRLGSVAWGDYDNDGDLDILLTGADAAGVRHSQVYRNEGGATPTFTDINAGLTSVYFSAVAWGDCDNDGDLDLLLTGDDDTDAAVTRLYRNSGAPPNTAPGAPSGLSTNVAGNQVTFSWAAASDAETPAAGLSYNLRVGTTPGGNEITAAMADGGNGYRRVVALGNVQQRTSWTLALPPGPGPFYWSVQAIDAAWAGGQFAAEQRLAPRFTEIPTGLPAVQDAAAAWGDYDNDGDLDILLTGFVGSPLFDITRVYRNDSGGFTDIVANLPGMESPSGTAVAWGDYDGDGDLDILLTGKSVAPFARVYRNDGGSFMDINAGLRDTNQGSVAWGDYDNDGDLDILLTGWEETSSGPISKIYRNEGGATFVETAASLEGVYNPSVAWGDYDRDGDLDILLVGDTNSGPTSKVYRNDGRGTFVENLTANLVAVSGARAAWGDYENDGDLDILLSGFSNSGVVSKVYRNDGAGGFVDIVAALMGVGDGSVAWGDYDNDGDLDILLTGSTGLGAAMPVVARVYRSDAGSFTDVEAGLPGVATSSAIWGDYDNDGDLDLLLTGNTYTPLIRITRLYRNNGVSPNTPPAAPTHLTATLNGTSVMFSWDSGTDDHTPATGLSYNLRVGTTPGGNEITAALAANSDGYRRVVALGNGQQRTAWTLTLPLGQFYWSVQAIDAAWAGGPFAAEQSFTIVPPSFTSSLDARVAASSDDAEENASGSVSLTSGDLELVYDGSVQKVGMRFVNLAIPRGANITRAYVQFAAREAQSEATVLVIRGQASDHAPAFTSSSRNVSQRLPVSPTAPSVAWDLTSTPWSAGQSGAGQQTPDLSGIVQEIVNRTGWAKGNALALLITGSGHRTPYSYDGSRALAPLLHVEFETSADLNRAPVVEAGVNQTITMPTSEALLDGTVADDGLPRSPGAVSTTWLAVGSPPGVTFDDSHAVDTRAHFTTAGSYLLRLTASDGALSVSDSVTIQVLPNPAAAVLERRVAASADDAEESASGSVSLGSSDLELVNDGSNQTVGMRFTNLGVPRGATVTRAYVTFRAREGQSVATALYFQCEPSDQALSFTSATRNVSRRRGGASTPVWNPGPWTTGSDYSSGELKDVIQPVVARAGWASGNAIVLIVTGTGHRTAQSFDGSSTRAPLLHLEYTTGVTPANLPPTVSAGPGQTITLPPGTAQLDGTVNDDGVGANVPPLTSWSLVSGPGPVVAFANASNVDTRATFTATGVYVLQLEADDGGGPVRDTVTIHVEPPGGGPITVETRVAASADDAEENASGVVSLTSSDLELTFDSSNQTVGMRFANLAIPRGAVITRAYVQFRAKETQSEATTVVMRGEASDHAAAFTTAARGISSRVRTLESLTWSPVAWNVVGVAGADQRTPETPELAAVIQRIVSRPGWVSGNALALIVTGTGHRTPYSWDGDPASAPLLHVEYTTAPALAAALAASASASRVGTPGQTVARVIPHPLRDHGAIELTLPRAGAVRIELYDVQGRRLRKLLDERELGEGVHRIDLGARLEPGLYFYRVQALDRKLGGRVLVLE